MIKNSQHPNRSKENMFSTFISKFLIYLFFVCTSTQICLWVKKLCYNVLYLVISLETKQGTKIIVYGLK